MFGTKSKPHDIIALRKTKLFDTLIQELIKAVDKRCTTNTLFLDKITVDLLNDVNTDLFITVKNPQNCDALYSIDRNNKKYKMVKDIIELDTVIYDEFINQFSTYVTNYNNNLDNKNKINKEFASKFITKPQTESPVDGGKKTKKQKNKKTKKQKNKKTHKKK
jgi:hypothetical protein